MKWRPPILNELTTILFDMELTHLGLEAPDCLCMYNFYAYSIMTQIFKISKYMYWVYMSEFLVFLDLYTYEVCREFILKSCIYFVF